MPVTRWLIALLAVALPAAQDQRPRSRAETSNYEETSRYDDVMAFIEAVRKSSPLVRVETFATTTEGRALPLVVLADPPIAQPAAAVRSGKPVVFIQANIHAGEVEGKEAAQHLIRRIAGGDLRGLLERLIVLVAPIYNADGNEKIAPDNRAEQNGPIGGVGRRENAAGLDLNRDYMKLEAAEARGLIGIFNRWDPHLTMDLHTTNGSHHGYHLTYAPPLNPDADPRLIAFHRERMIPAIDAAVEKLHKFRIYYYGNFSEGKSLPGFKELPGRDGKAATRVWRTFDHRPRFGNNYTGLRNRLALLSEAYSYLDFRGRVAVTEAFCVETLKFAEANAAAIVQLVRQLDADTKKTFASTQRGELGTSFGPAALPEPVEILVGAVEKIANLRSGRQMTAMLPDAITPTPMWDYGLFAATASAAVPAAYLVKPDGLPKAALDLLLAHGLSVEQLTNPLTTDVDVLTVASIRRAERPFQGHREASLTGQSRSEHITFPEGSLVIRTAQPLGRLAFYLLEPTSDDGLVTWNMLDEVIAEGQPHPVYKLMKGGSVSSRPLRR